MQTLTIAMTSSTNCFAAFSTNLALRALKSIDFTCSAITKPVNVLARPNLSLREIADAGARRISVGGRLTWVAVNALVDAATAIRDHGDFSSLDRSPDFEKWLAP